MTVYNALKKEITQWVQIKYPPILSQFVRIATAFFI